jgi:hypothetical protein
MTMITMTHELQYQFAANLAMDEARRGASGEAAPHNSEMREEQINWFRCLARARRTFQLLVF